MMYSGQKCDEGHQSTAQLSIVVPAYNECGNLSKLYQGLREVLSSLNIGWEIIIVDDGSTDSTWGEISTLQQQDSGVKGLRLSRNFGHQYALFAGLSNATGQAVITMDADMQHPPAVIPQLFEQWQRGSKIVHTMRIDHQNISRMKRITSRIFYRVFTLLSGVELSPGMADFRLLDRQVVDKLLQLKEEGLFLRGLVQWVGHPSSRVEFQCRERFSGETKYNLAKMLRFAWTGVTSFSLIPLRVAIILGFITSVIAFNGIIYALWAKLVTGTAVPGWASAMSVLSLLFGILFILLGIIGEYIGRILQEVRGRPRFIISERIGFPLPDVNIRTIHTPTLAQNREV